MSPRLILIDGPTMSLYHGRERQGDWETGDPAWPVDQEYLNQLLAVVYDLQWALLAGGAGRCFPLLKTPD